LICTVRSLAVVQIASLPHIELEFVVPRTGIRHSSLFLVDTGAGGTEVMFHSRAARELHLLKDERQLQNDIAYGHSQTHYVSGVDDGKSSTHNAPTVAVQSGKLPEIIIRGQAGSNPQACGSLVLRDVGALFSQTGGLDISLYSAGMVCIDLLSRMQVVLDYPNKRIGWKVPQQQQQQQEEGVGLGAAAAAVAAADASRR
jgi:predicted aspartyl protease